MNGIGKGENKGGRKTSLERSIPPWTWTHSSKDYTKPDHYTADARMLLIHKYRFIFEDASDLWASFQAASAYVCYSGLPIIRPEKI